MDKKKVILVDDDEDLLVMLKFFFEGAGFETREFTTGNKALTYILNTENMTGVSLIVLDRILPDMDGLDLLEKIIEKYGNKIPVLILSVLSADKDVILGLKKGAVDYIGKPFNHEVLMERALSLISRVPHV